MPPPCHVKPTLMHACCVWLARQKPLVAQHAPVGSGQKVALHALALPPNMPPWVRHAAGVATEHEPEFVMQHAPVGHAPLAHADPLA